MSDEPRYFVDHGTIHDRVTGKHVDIEEAAGMLSVEPAAMQRIAWGVATGIVQMVRDLTADRDRLAAEVRELRVIAVRLATEATHCRQCRDCGDGPCCGRCESEAACDALDAFLAAADKEPR